MARHSREDAPGSWHHVMNRGIARRTLFETERDIRYFLSRLARCVRDGLIEIHAFCVMTTHFHLLVRSPEAELSLAMQRAQNQYVRWFNRSRRRDGTLLRGRFRSRPVRTLSYRRILVRYIDANPVAAGLVASPALYPHGSARCYAKPVGPPWLDREWVEAYVQEVAGSASYRPGDYASAFGGSLPAQVARLVEKRIDGPTSNEDPLDELLKAAPGQVTEWMQRKALLADGTGIGVPVCDSEASREVLREARETAS